MLRGGAFNAKPVLNTVVSSVRGDAYPLAKRGLDELEGVWGQDKG